MWTGVLGVGLRVAMWITHVGGKFRHGLLEQSLNQKQTVFREGVGMASLASWCFIEPRLAIL